VTEDWPGLLSFGELRAIADRRQISIQGDMGKEALASFVFETLGDEYKGRDLPIQIETERQYSADRTANLFPVPEEDNGLPGRYCETNLVLMLRDPSWVYCYWDIENRILTKFAEEESFSGLVLRITELDGANWARESRIDWFDIPIQFKDLHRYINLPAENTCYGAEIYAQIGSRDFVIVRSNIVESSRDCLSPLPYTLDSNRDQLIELFEIFHGCRFVSGKCPFPITRIGLQEVRDRWRTADNAWRQKEKSFCPSASCASAICTPSGTREIPGRELAL